LIAGQITGFGVGISITGKQFNWIYRYPGKDNTFGKKYFRLIDDGNSNQLGMLWRDTTLERRNNNNEIVGTQTIKADPAGFDDIIETTAMYLVVNEPVKLIINSRDVIHDVGLSHFRLKMDAVPGTPTTMWFIPKYTTDKMKEITNNPDFEYEISCDQMCGNNHFAMRGLIKVVTRDEFILWRAKQQAAYTQAFPPAGSTPAPATADTSQAATKTAAVIKP